MLYLSMKYKHPQDLTCQIKIKSGKMGGGTELLNLGVKQQGGKDQ